MALEPPACPWSHGSSLPMLSSTRMCSFMGQIIFFGFSSKFHFLLVPENSGLCLCRGLLHGSDAQSHPLQPGASKQPRSRANPPAAARCSSGRVVHAKHTVFPPATTRFFPGESSAAPTHCARAQHRCSRRSQRCLSMVYIALLLQSSPPFCRDLGFETGRLQCRNISC